MGKAVIYTITFFLLSTILLGLSFLLFQVSNTSEELSTQLSVNNRINDLSTSISNSMSTIFISKSGINISVVNNTISFQEIIPNNYLSNYTNSIDDLKTFVENRENFVTIDNNNIDTTQLLIMPVNGAFYNENSGADQDKRFITNFVNIEELDLYVYGANTPVESIFWQEFKAGNTKVIATFENGTKKISQTRYADLVGDGSGDEFRVTFYMGAGEDDDMDIEVRDGNLLKVFDFRYDTLLNMTITYDTDETLKVYMDNKVTVDIPEFNITKVTRPRIV